MKISKSVFNAPLKNLGAWGSEHDFDSILFLKDTEVRMPQNGIVLRHYWFPATDLIFHQYIDREPDSQYSSNHKFQIERNMVSCCIDKCAWRENVAFEQEDRFKMFDRKLICSYNCFDQTYVEYPPLQFCQNVSDREILASQDRAIQRMPILPFPGIIHVGFSWYIKTKSSFMNYKIVSMNNIDGTSVLVIKRNGCFSKKLHLSTSRLYGKTKHEKPSNGYSIINAQMERVGSTLFAWKRGVVLEDKWRDKILESDLGMPAGYIYEQSIFHLVNSSMHEICNFTSLNRSR